MALNPRIFTVRHLSKALARRLAEPLPFSGASMPFMRILCCFFSESSTVIVSPSAMATTRPEMINESAPRATLAAASSMAKKSTGRSHARGSYVNRWPIT